MGAKLTMKAGTRLEIGVGKVTEGKEAWMYGEYFPAAGPVMREFGQQSGCAFAVVATNTEGVTPVQGSLTAWPTAENRRKCLADPRMVDLIRARDAALDVLSDGHLFEPIDAEIELDTDADYAISISDDAALSDPLFALPLAGDSQSTDYAGKSIRLHRWSDEAERLLGASPADAAVYRVRFMVPS